MSVTLEKLFRRIDDLPVGTRKAFYENGNNTSAAYGFTPLGLFGGNVDPRTGKRADANQQLLDYFMQTSRDFRSAFHGNLVKWRAQGLTFEDIFAGKIRAENWEKLLKKADTRPELLEALV